jgi:hypothetical protein
MLKFAEQYNYCLLSNLVNKGFQVDEDKHQRTYEIKLEDGSTISYHVYLINEPKNRSLN